jgi:hypothetical protein
MEHSAKLDSEKEQINLLGLLQRLSSSDSLWLDSLLLETINQIQIVDSKSSAFGTFPISQKLMYTTDFLQKLTFREFEHPSVWNYQRTSSLGFGNARA